MSRKHTPIPVNMRTQPDLLKTWATGGLRPWAKRRNFALPGATSLAFSYGNEWVYQ